MLTPNHMRKILLTNDDGINSEGLARLARAAKEIGDVWVVAPDSERSAMSHSVTLRKPVVVPHSKGGVLGRRAHGKV